MPFFATVACNLDEITEGYMDRNIYMRRINNIFIWCVVFVFLYTYVCMHGDSVCTYVCVYVCVYACMYVCNVCVCNVCLYVLVVCLYVCFFVCKCKYNN